MIIITGTSGFIASNVVRELNRRGHTDLVAVDDYPSLRNVANLTRDPQGRYAQQFQVAGFLDMHRLPDWLRRDGTSVTVVIHLGACSDTTATDRDWIMENNFAYTQKLWDWCVQSGRTFVYASSAATYGDGSQGYDDRCDPSRYRPLNLYGESKHQFDLWALAQPKAPPRWAGLKYFNVYGPNETHKGRMASVAFHGFQQISQTGRMRLFRSCHPAFSDGDQKRDFVYVRDVVRATLHFAGNSTKHSNGLFNVGTGEARSFNDLARSIFRALRCAERIDYVPMPDDLHGRYQYFTEAVIGKLRDAGFTEPMTPLEDGVCDYVQNYLNFGAVAA